ncbi:MAG: NfeD family protein [Candidatus Symbiodolus clandestinus]
MSWDLNVTEFLFYPPHFWFILGCLLLSAESLGAAGYLFWLGLSAWMVVLISWLLPTLGWFGLWSCFSLCSLVTVLLWYYGQQRSQHQSMPSGLNQPQQQLVGYRAILSSDLSNGIGRLQIGDSSWRVQADHDLPAGTPVVVIAIEGNTLRLQAVEHVQGPSSS